MVNTGITLYQLFGYTQDKLPDVDFRVIESGKDLSEMRETLKQQLSDVKWETVGKEIHEHLEGLLNIPLGLVLARGWVKYRQIKKHIKEQLEKGSDDTALVPLVTHEFSSKHEPHLKILLNNIQLSDLAITVKLKLKLSGVTLKIQHGRIQKIIAGKASGKGIIAYRGVAIAEKEILNLNLPAEVVIPEKLTAARPKESTAQKPAQSQSPAVVPSSSNHQTGNHPAP